MIRDILTPLVSEKFLNDEHYREGHLKVLNALPKREVLGMHSPDMKEVAKRLMHLCFTSKHEVLCRCPRDYKMMISRIAQASIYNDSGILAYAVMSNHVHLIVQTEKESAFIRTLRSSYTQSFNHIYGRKGRLGDERFYALELEGIPHQQDAITYVLQNPWHHKVTDNPFDYPYSSMNLYYRRNILEAPPVLHDIYRSHRLLNRNVNLNAPVCYGASGIIVPESFVQVRMVENIFGTYTELTHTPNYDLKIKKT